MTDTLDIVSKKAGDIDPVVKSIGACEPIFGSFCYAPIKNQHSEYFYCRVKGEFIGDCYVVSVGMRGTTGYYKVAACFGDTWAYAYPITIPHVTQLSDILLRRTLYGGGRVMIPNSPLVWNWFIHEGYDRMVARISMYRYNLKQVLSDLFGIFAGDITEYRHDFDLYGIRPFGKVLAVSKVDANRRNREFMQSHVSAKRHTSIDGVLHSRYYAGEGRVKPVHVTKNLWAYSVGDKCMFTQEDFVATRGDNNDTR